MLISQRPTLTEEPVADNRSRFVIEPLEPGFGYTLGNSLRRTLLSSIPGASVTSIRVDGVLHEFTTVPGVKEDITELILNLKELVVSSEDDEPVTMYLRKQGPGDVTAADIAPPAGVTVHNSGPHLATLTKKGKLEIELVVERGRGYVPARPTRSSAPRSAASRSTRSTRRSSRSPTASRPPASSSGPTSTGSCSTSRPSRPSPRGTRWPRPAPPWWSCSAWPASSTSTPKASRSGPSPAEADHIAAFALPIEEMDLTVRSYNCLKREGIHTVGELVSRTEADLLDIRNFGQKSIDEVKIKLHRHGPGPEGLAGRVRPRRRRPWPTATRTGTTTPTTAATARSPDSPPRSRTTPTTPRPSRSNCSAGVTDAFGGCKAH